MNSANTVGVPTGGFTMIGEIDGTNDLRFRRNQTAMTIALDLLSSHASGAPITDEAGRFIGFVSEHDLLGAIESGKDLNKVAAEHLMNREHFVANESTSITDAIRLMR